MARRNKRRKARYASLLDAEGNTREESVAKGRDKDAGRHYAPGTDAGAYAYVASKKYRRRRISKAPIVIALLLLAGIGAGGAWYWWHRPVAVTVNGEVVEVPLNSSIEDVRETLDMAATPGNLVSVGGTVLTEGVGEAFSLTVNGEEVASEEIDAIKLAGGEVLEFGTGKDVLEDYDVEVRETAPKLEFAGEDRGSVTYVAQWGKARRQEIRHGRMSGETADGDVLDEGQNCLIVSATPVPEGEKLVALTFDDGPSSYTQAYLDIFARYDVQVTFFNLAIEEEDFPGEAAAVVAAGHQIMNHTNQHLQLTSVPADQMVSEITSAAATIERISGVKTTSLRPPYGDFNEKCWLWSQGVVSLSVLWTQDSEDWRQQSVDSIVQNALANITSGSIILMHDGGGNRDMDLEALPRIIESLQADGYRLVSVGELLRACPEIPEDVASGYAPMPEDAVWPTEMA